MTKNKLALLILVILVLGLVVFLNSRQGSRQSQSSVEIFSGINGEQISKIEISKGAKSIVLQTSEEGWGLTEKGGYSANVGKIRSLLLKLMDLRSSQILRPSEEGLKKLAVDEGGVKDGFGKIVLSNAQGQVLGGVYIGKSRVRDMSAANGARPISSGGQYVRRLDGEEVYLISEPLILSAADDEWIDNNLMNILSKNIHKIEQFSNDQLDFSLVRTSPISSYADTQLTLPDDVPEGKEMHDSMLSQVSSGLENVRFSDVSPLSSKPEIRFDKVTKYYLTSGLVYSVHSASGADDILFAKFDVVYDQNLVDELKALEAAQQKQVSESSESAENEDGSSSSSASQEKLEFSSAEEAENLAKNYSKWIYQFAGFQGSKFRKQKADLLRDKEVAAEKES